MVVTAFACRGDVMYGSVLFILSAEGSSDVAARNRVSRAISVIAPGDAQQRQKRTAGATAGEQSDATTAC